MDIVFGSAYFQNKLWFDPDPAVRTAPIPANRIDAFSVVLHELGHAIAYSGWADGQGGAPVPRMGCDGLYPAEAPPSSESSAAAPPSGLLDQLMNGVSYYYQHRYDISDLDIGVLRDVGLPYCFVLVSAVTLATAVRAPCAATAAGSYPGESAATLHRVHCCAGFGS